MLSIVNIPFPVRERWGWCSVKYSLWLGIHSSKDWYLFLVQIFLNVCPTSTDSEVVTLERRWLLACYVLQGPQMMQNRSSLVPAAPWKEHRVKEGHAPWGCQGAAGEWSTVGSVPQTGRRKTQLPPQWGRHWLKESRWNQTSPHRKCTNPRDHFISHQQQAKPEQGLGQLPISTMGQVHGKMSKKTSATLLLLLLSEPEPLLPYSKQK